MDLAQMTAELAQRKAFLPGKTVNLDFAEDGAIVLDGVDGHVTNNQEAQADTTLHISWDRSEEHTSELQSLMRISYAVFSKKKKPITNDTGLRHNLMTKTNRTTQRET